MRRTMKLRTRLFLFVACVFLVMQLFSLITSYIDVTRHIDSAKAELEVEIREYNKKQVHDYLSFLTISIAEVELRINTLFHKITDYKWLKEQYAPSNFNFETNQWSNSVMLVASNQWIDFIQTTVREKLTSQLIMRPPYLHNMFTVPLDDVITIVAGVHDDQSLAMFIGVPYWSSEFGSELEQGYHDILFSLDTSRKNWLLFTPQQIMGMKSSQVHARDPVIPVAPLSTDLEIKKRELFQKLIDMTLASLFRVQDHLIKNPKILQKLNSPDWVKENVLNQIELARKGFPRGIDSCESYICKSLKQNERENPWITLHDWRERDDQNRLVWELGTITGTGIWYFDPLSANAPKGLASFQIVHPGDFDDGSPKVGYGVFSSDVFKDKRIDVHPNCKPDPIKGKLATCITDQFELLRSPSDYKAIFLVNTLLFESEEKDTQDPSFGTLTAGVNISPILEKLALISPDRVLFLSEEGPPLMFDTHGQSIDLSGDQRDFLQKLKGRNEGIVTDADEKEYYFLHVTSVTHNDGHIFVIQDKDSVFKQIDDLEERAKALMYGITLQLALVGFVVFLVVLVLIHFFVRRIVQPIQDLADMTVVVARGDLDEVVIPQKDKARKDELGILVNAFEDMVEKMKEGNQIRAILHKVVNKEVAEKIIREGVELGGEVRQVGILFSDIRDFTHISENMPPQDVLAMLNDCLTVLSQVIDDHKGVIDKYVGDEIMALFGAPVTTENPAMQSILCAIKMMQVLTEWNRHRVAIQYCELKIGIGIHVGEVIAGNMGAANHLNYTILGHNVNLASRLCDHAEEMEILITEDTLNAPGVREKFQVEACPPVTFKGISVPTSIFRVKY